MNSRGHRHIGVLISFMAALVLLGGPRFAAADFDINMMGHLIVGDIKNPQKTPQAWRQFKAELIRAKSLSTDAISTDLWWGAIEPEEGRYNWEYSDRIAEAMAETQSGWIPILSLHQLGGNVGDVGSIPVPDYLWTKYIGQPGVTDRNSLKFKSELGNYNSETVSVWGTPYILEDIRRYFEAFQERYASKAHLIKEINISLGPAGELRYPSYNSHDGNIGYPGPGAFQGYSELAVQSFRNYVVQKYGGLEKINQVWGSKLTTIEQISPPRESMRDFYHNEIHFSKYGKDLFDWYNSSLTEHGQMILRVAAETFNRPDSPFRGIKIGAKVPGIHWRISIDRLAELNAGLIRTSLGDWFSETSGHGYYSTFKAFSDLAHETGAPMVVHFTALEMNNGHEGPAVGSEAKSLVFWIGQLAKQLGLELKGENALGEHLKSKSAWANILDAMTFADYSGITLLRMDQILNSPEMLKHFKRLVQRRDLESCRKLVGVAKKRPAS